MLSDPQILTIAGVAKTMPKISTSGTSSTYSTDDEGVAMQVTHQVTKSGRVRHDVTVTQRKVVADPLTAENDYQSVSFKFVVDRPEYGFSASDVDATIAAIKTWLSTATVTKLYGRES